MFISADYYDFEHSLQGYFSKEAIVALYDYYMKLEQSHKKPIAIDPALVKGEWIEFASFDEMVERLISPTARRDWENSHLREDGDFSWTKEEFSWTKEEERNFEQHYNKKLSQRYVLHPFGDKRYLVEGDPALKWTGQLGYIVFSTI